MTTIRFTVDGLPPDAITPFQVTGEEAISRLYSFTIDCDYAPATPPGATLIGARTVLEIEQPGTIPRTVHGVIEGFGIVSPDAPSRAPTIRFRLVPELAVLRHSRQNHIFGTETPVTIPAVIEAEMNGTLRAGNRATQPTHALPYAMRLHQEYSPYDHLAQYEETNFDFLSRIAERAGIFWFFETGQEHDGTQERVVFADSNVSCPYIPGDSALPWHPWTPATAKMVPDTIQHLDSWQDQTSAAVFVRTQVRAAPLVDLFASHPVAAGNPGAAWEGAWAETVQPFYNRAQGDTLARIRSEEMAAHSQHLTARTMVTRLAAGHVFTLQDHPFDSWNQPYLVLSVRHAARVPRAGLDDAPAQDFGYSNTATLLPLSVPFRPARITPRPTIAGLSFGRVESNLAGTGPMIDSQGRYRIRMAFDLSTTPKGEASRWMPLAAPFGGQGDGMHFPLYPGTEVIVAHIRGDPDRPVILGTLPDPAQPSLVTNQDSDRNRLTFRTGMGLDAHGPTAASADSPADPPAMRLWSGSGTTPGPYHWLRLGKSEPLVTATGGAETAEGPDAADGFDLATGATGRLYAPQDLYLIRNGSAAGSPDAAGPNRFIAIQESGLTLAHDGTLTLGQEMGQSGNPGDVKLNSGGGFSEWINGRHTSYIGGEDMTVNGGAVQNFVLGSRVLAVAGANSGINLGVVLNLNMAFALTLNLTASLTITAGTSGELVYAGGKFGWKPSATDINLLKTQINQVQTNLNDEVAAITGGSDLSIANLQTRLVNVNNRIHNTRNTVGNLNNSVNQLSNRVQQVETSVGDVANDVVQVKSEIIEINNTISEIKTFL